MSGLQAKEDLKRSMGHFKSGTVTTNNNDEPVVSFEVDINVTKELLAEFNNLSKRIPGCIRVDGVGKRQVHVVFNDSSKSQEVMRSALDWRAQAIGSFAHPSVTAARKAAIPQVVFSHA